VIFTIAKQSLKLSKAGPRMASTPPFGLVLPSRPVLVNPTVISPTQYAFAFPSVPAFTHIVVFLLPGNTLPEHTLAGVYVQFPGSTPDFKLLGAIGTDKQSAILRITNNGTDTPGKAAAGEPSQVNGMTEEAMSDVEGTATAGEVTVGISIEPAGTIMAQLEAPQASNPTAMVVSRAHQQGFNPPSTKLLAQRIIKNAFNFLASFAGTSGVGGQEVVPLRSFQDWWSKFERRIENDPGFLERVIDD